MPELVAAARGGDAASWTELVGRYELLVRQAVAGYRLQEADAADAVQNTWLRALEQLASLRDPERFGGWLRTTAGRECVAVLRRARRERPGADDLDELTSDAPGPEAHLLVEETRRAVETAVDRLPGRNREVIRLMFLTSGPGYAEISRATGIPLGSIGPTRGRALQVLRRSLATFS